MNRFVFQIILTKRKEGKKEKREEGRKERREGIRKERKNMHARSCISHTGE